MKAPVEKQKTRLSKPKAKEPFLINGFLKLILNPIKKIEKMKPYAPKVSKMSLFSWEKRYV